MSIFELNGATRIHVIIGDPIEQVKSPSGLTPIMQGQGVNAILIPIQISPEDVDGFMENFKKVKNMDGIVVTIPHKFAAYKHCDLVGPRSSFLGITNVLRREPNGLWAGDHTDGPGFLGGMRQAGADPKGQKALLIGAGGAGSAIALELLQEGAAQLAVHDIDVKRRDDLIAKLNRRYPGMATAGSNDPKGFGVVVNGSPLGMNADDPLPVDVSRLESSAFVGDVVTDPKITPLIEEACKRGCKTQIGAGMFDGQAEILVDFLFGRTTMKFVPRKEA